MSSQECQRSEATAGNWKKKNIASTLIINHPGMSFLEHVSEHVEEKVLLENTQHDQHD